MKRTMTLLLVLTLLLALPATAVAGINIVINSQEYAFDPPPMIQESRTLVPMRAFFEALGADVSWEAETQTAVGVREGVEVRIPIGSTRPTVNGQRASIDVPALIFENRTFIPLRFVGEALGDQVGWEGSTRTITITKGDGVPKITPLEVDDDQDQLVVHFIDVGQGDSILIESPGGKVVLIDGGPRTAGQKVVSYLKKAGISAIDIVIGTHPHEDHIGGLIEVLRHFPAREIIDPGVVHTTKTFEDYLTVIDQRGIPFTEGRAGMSRDLGAGAVMQINHPSSPSSSHLNDASIVAKVTYGQMSFLFTGDAETASEREILFQSRVSPKSTVLKVGHHGSRTSTTQAFLDAVAPRYAIIMCGAGNRYGHPHQEVLDRLSAAGVHVFRTDIHGTIVMSATTDSVVIETLVHDTTPIPVPDPGYVPVPEPGPEPAPAPTPGPAPTPAPAPTPTPGRVNINTAGFEDLQEIIHIGPARAEEIITLRPFRSLDGLTRVTGIGPARLKDIKEQGIAYVE